LVSLRSTVDCGVLLLEVIGHGVLLRGGGAGGGGGGCHVLLPLSVVVVSTVADPGPDPGLSARGQVVPAVQPGWLPTPAGPAGAVAADPAPERWSAAGREPAEPRPAVRLAGLSTAVVRPGAGPSRPAAGPGVDPSRPAAGPAAGPAAAGPWSPWRWRSGAMGRPHRPARSEERRVGKVDVSPR